MLGDESKNIGKQIGSNYRIVAELGRGGFGEVYKAQHIFFANRPLVAIKLLRASLRSPKERDRFIQEAQLLNALTHPHILPILDAGMHEEDLPYIVMEYASGGSLQDRLNQQPGQPLSIDEAITLLKHIGEALHYAHQQNIVHRDLKPDNILFNTKGEAVLADFGIAVILSSLRTKVVGDAGTPAYMAPEMFKGKVSIKSDQYALGCIAYELVTGRKPFEVEGVPIYAAHYQHAHVKPTAPTQHNPEIPAHIEQAILKAMTKERTERYEDVAAFIAALQKSSQQWLNEGNALYNLHQYEEALTAYEQARHLDSKNVAIYRSIATLLLDINRYENALTVLEQASQLTSQDAWIYTQKGIAMRNTRQEEAALAAHDQAIQLSPNDHWVLCEKAITLRAFKRYEEALPVHDQAIQANTNDAWGYVQKAITLRDLKQEGESLKVHDQAIQADPNSAWGYIEKAITLRGFKRYEEALIAHDQALQCKPNDPWYYSEKARTLRELKRYKEALVVFDQALQLRPADAHILTEKAITIRDFTDYE